MAEKLSEPLNALTRNLNQADLSTYPTSNRSITEARGSTKNAQNSVDEAGSALMIAREKTEQVVSSLTAMKEEVGTANTAAATNTVTASVILGSAEAVLDGTGNDHAVQTLTHLRTSHNQMSEAKSSTLRASVDTDEAIGTAAELIETLGKAATLLASLLEKVDMARYEILDANDKADAGYVQNHTAIEEFRKYRSDIGQ